MNTPQLIPLALIEPDFARDQLLPWLDAEIKSVRARFGSDEEALKYWPDDYYEKLEKNWSEGRREPLELIACGDFYRINDGWHRFAIAYKLRTEVVPAYVERIVP